MSNRDIYTWRVIFEDGTLVEEYDLERSDGRGFAEIGEKPVKRLELEANNDNNFGYLHDLTTSHSMLIPHGATPVFFRRRRVEINPNTDEIQGSSTVHCIGWKREENEGVPYKIAAMYLFIYADGSTLVTDDLQAG